MPVKAFSYSVKLIQVLLQMATAALALNRAHKKHCPSYADGATCQCSTDTF